MKCKRLLALALAAALCVVAAACGTKSNEPDTPAKTDTPTAAPGGTQTVGDTGDGTVREDGSYVPGQVNRLRLTYNGNVSSALYVTSGGPAAGLPGAVRLRRCVLQGPCAGAGAGVGELRLRGGGHRVRVPEGGPHRRGGADPSGPRRGAGRAPPTWLHGCCGRRWTPDWRITSGRWPIRRWSPSCLSIDQAIPNPRLPRRRGFFGALPCRTHWKMRRR